MLAAIFLVSISICLLFIYYVLHQIFKLLQYWDSRRPRTFADVIKILSASTYELEVEVESKLQTERWGDQEHQSKWSQEIPQEDEPEVDQLLEGLKNSPFFKNLNDTPLRAVVEALQIYQPRDSNCIYHSDSGINQLLLLSSQGVQGDRGTILTLQDSQFSICDSRLLFSPSNLSCALLSVPCPTKFQCSIHSTAQEFWSITYAELINCLQPWPEAKQALLQQFWTFVNEDLLHVFAQWLNLDTDKFLQATEFDKMLIEATDRLDEETPAGVDFSSMSFYERTPLYKLLTLRLLNEIASMECCSQKHLMKISVSFHPAGDVIIGRTAFLVLDGCLEAVTHPTLSPRFDTSSWKSQEQRRKLPGYVGLLQFFCHSPLPFKLTSATTSQGVIVAELPDELMDEMFSPVAAYEAASKFLMRQLNPQVFQYDLLFRNRRLHHGDFLVRAGDLADTVQIIVSGRLRCQTMEFGRGDSVGLVEGLVEATDRRWPSDVVAVRESRALSLPLALARSWVSQDDRLLLLDRNLGSMCQQQMDRAGSRAKDETARTGCWARGRSEALVGLLLDPDRFNKPAVLDLLRSCLLEIHGDAACLLSEADVLQHFGRPPSQLPEAALQTWLEQKQLRHPVLLLSCGRQLDLWNRLVLGFLDCLLVFCDADGAGGEEPSETELQYARMFRCSLHLAVLHPLSLCPVPLGTSLRFLRHRPWTARVFHIRCSSGRYRAGTWPRNLPQDLVGSDMARLLRCVTGRAVGLALGADGSRGMGNFGALEALLKAGAAVDVMAGSGRGALVAAAWALHHGNLRETWRCLQRLLARVDGPLAVLSDLTLPLVSWRSGSGLNAGLREMLGQRRQAEDTWLPCALVSTDLLGAQPVTLTSGTLWRSVRATCGRVGIDPPVWDPRSGRLLLDGVHTDRLPAGCLRRLFDAAFVVAIALDVEQPLRPGSYRNFGDTVSGTRELLESLNPLHAGPPAPSAADIQAALSSIAGGAAHHGLDEPGGWCLTVRPDPALPAHESIRSEAAERWVGYWAVVRWLRMLSARQRAALNGCKGGDELNLARVQY